MKIIIRDFGPISKFEFDLSKDLNIIFGKNNIGKSYAITAVYLLLKNLIIQADLLRNFELEMYFFQRNIQDKGKSTISTISKLVNEAEKKIIETFKSKSPDEFEITDLIERILKEIVDELIIQKLENSFKNSFSSIEDLSNKISGNKLKIDLEYADFVISIESKDNKLVVKTITLRRHITVKRAISHRKPLINQDRFIIYFNKKSNTLHLMQDCISRLFFGFSNEISSLINNVYFLPASRSGLYQALSTFSAVIAELSKSRTFVTSKIELPNISEPVSDYFLNLSNIGPRVKNDYRDLVEKIESKILKGKILFNKETKKIVFSQNEINAELDLSFTSSMISEIAPIVAYLKYIIKKETEHYNSAFMINRSQKDDGYSLIFIEEPEAHLHPEIQVQLMEIFLELAQKKVKIIMTTHSNYMFNKLSNLILNNKIDHEKVGSYLMRVTPQGSVIDAVKMKAEEDGIKDENFVDIAEALYEERIAIYDKLNSTK